MATYDTWGGSWGTSWALSWTREIPTPPPPVDAFRATPGCPLDPPLSMEELDRLIREQRMDLGILPRPEAREAVQEAVIAQQRAVSSVDTESKLSAARAQLEAEETFANVYGAVRGDLERERLSELFRVEVERERARRRKVAIMLLLN